MTPTKPTRGHRLPDSARPEAELVALVRDGVPAAYAELYRRHLGEARRYAAALGYVDDIDDIVAETFTRVFALLQQGAGPTAFRPYLFVSLRNIHRNFKRRRKNEHLMADMSDTDEVVDDELDRRLVDEGIGRALSRLPERWQTVLWLTAVEGRTNAEVAEHLGIRPNSAAALSFRAREGLRQAYLADHLPIDGAPECRDVVAALPAYLRSSLTTRRREEINAHLGTCDECADTLSDLTAVARDFE
jgi:RNA polymerase sigma factor (sigma-70 family)